jgi:hypothetical protein
MSEAFQEIAPQPDQGDEPVTPQKPRTNWLDSLANLGLGDVAVRIGTNVLTLVAVFVVVWLMKSFYQVTPAGAAGADGPVATPQVEMWRLPPCPRQKQSTAALPAWR